MNAPSPNIEAQEMFAAMVFIQPHRVDDAFSVLCSFALSAEYEELSGSVLRSLSFDASDEYTLTLSLECEALSPLHFKIPLRITLGDATLDGEIGFVSSDAYPILIATYRSLPLTTIQRLDIVYRDEFPSDLWREILERLEGLRYMKLILGPMPDLSLLSFPAHESDEKFPGVPDQHPSRRMFVPALEELEYHFINYRSGQNSPLDFVTNTFPTRKGLHCKFTP